MDCCGGGLDVGVVGSGHAACTSSSAGWCGHPNPGGMWSGHAPSERRVHQNCRPSWREQVCQGSDLLNTRAAVSQSSPTRTRSDRSSVLCQANAGRYFAAVVGSSDLVFESIADDEFVGITTEIPAMKKRSAPPARGRINPKLRSTTQPFNVPIGMSFSSGVDGLIPRSAK